MEVGRKIGVHKHNVIAIGFQEAMFDVVAFSEFVLTREDLDVFVEFSDQDFGKAHVLVIAPI